MVFVNSKKFACESCIKGHRSSSCSHTDRPLFEVKKKGRPVSQCEKCRELRQSKKVHSKCNCNPTQQKRTKPPTAPGQKPPRFIPIAPALPNGIKDVIRVGPASSSSSSRQRVDVLLNPCSCKKPAWNCKCLETPASQSSESSGLAALARAAELYSPTKPPNSFRKFTRSPSPDDPQKHPPKHAKHHHNADNTPGPELAPLFLFDSPYPSADTIPDFGVMPPIKEITSLAGSGCTCGIECSCPGCIEHRGAENADPDYPNPATGGCGLCVDNRSGIGLPVPASSFPSLSTLDSAVDNATSASRMIDQFFARAAALPSPPVNRKMGAGMQLDPRNVIVYPSAAMETKERGVPFGLITIPKLECCGGNCGCPAGSCSCGKSCDGCCAEHLHAKASSTPPSSDEQSTAAPVVDGLTAVRVISAPVPVRRSCCSK